MSLNWRDFQVSKPMDKMDKMDKSPESTPFCPLNPFCPCESGLDFEDSTAQTSNPADTPPPPVETAVPGLNDTVADTPTPAPDDDWRSAIPRDTMRRIIEKEQATWTPEHRQAQEDEIRRGRGSSPRPGPGGGIPRAEALRAVGEVLARLGKIWPDGLEPDPEWQAKVGEAERADSRDAFRSVIEDWEASETRRVEAHMTAIHAAVASWPDEFRRRFSLIMAGGWVAAGISGRKTTRGISPNAAMDRAYQELLPYVQARIDALSAASPVDDFPFTDMHPRTREILLRHWNTWNVARRERFEQDVRDVMKRTGYSEGNAAAFVFEKWGKR